MTIQQQAVENLGFTLTVSHRADSQTLKHWTVTSKVSDGEMTFWLTRQVELLPPGCKHHIYHTEEYGQWLYGRMNSFETIKFTANVPGPLATLFGDTLEKRVHRARSKAQRLADRLNAQMDNVERVNKMLAELDGDK